jgi:hypothetical protein
MKLQLNWFTEGIVDFEHKKYILLAYLKSVTTRFKAIKLYPELGELIGHLRNLKAFAENKELMASQFPKQFTGVDMNQLRLSYKAMLEDDEVSGEIERIIQYALPKMDSVAKQGMEIYDYLEEHIKIEPVGIEPIYKKEGYLLMSKEKEPDVRVYRYKWQFFTSDENKFVGLETKYLFTELRSWLSHAVEVKYKLIKRFTDLPNPACYRIHSAVPMPVQETFLPLAKRLLIKRLAVVY